MDAELAEIESLCGTSYARYRNALATITGSYESARDAVEHGPPAWLAHDPTCHGDSRAAGRGRGTPHEIGGDR
jgi:hypothetical protein